MRKPKILPLVEINTSALDVQKGFTEISNATSKIEPIKYLRVDHETSDRPVGNVFEK